MAPRYVKPYVKRQKNDAADAEAICEAVTRPTMRFVEIKSPDRQHAARKRGQIASGPVNGPRGPGRPVLNGNQTFARQSQPVARL